MRFLTTAGAVGAGSFALIGIGLMVEAQFGDNP